MSADPVALLTELVAVPSVNPLLPGAVAGDGEHKVAALVAQQFRDAGIDVVEQEVRDGRCNVVAHLPRAGAADDAVVLLTAHMDTYPEGGPRSGYGAVRDGDLLYARGSADAKGPLAAMITAALRAAAAPDHREAWLVATVDEECLLQGAYALTELGIRPALAVTGEPTSLVPIVAQKGIVRGRLRVRGGRSHAAYPTADTAVARAARVVEAVAKLNSGWAVGPTDPVLGAPTFSLTRLVSDGGMNLMATEVDLWFDGRFLPGTTGAAFAADVLGLLAARLGPDTAPELVEITFVSPPNRADTDASVVHEFCATVAEVAGSCVPEGFSYGSEAGVLAGFSDAAVVFGPGDARWSHAETEVIDVGELRRATEIFHRLLVGPTPSP